MDESVFHENSFIVDEAVNFYFDVYTEYNGITHPHLKKEQLESIKDELGVHISEYCLDLDDIKKMITYFFKHPPKSCDFNINLFVTKSVFVRVGYSVGVISGYADL